MNYKWVHLNLFLVVLAFAACKERSFHDASEPEHEAGRPVRGEVPWMWVDLDREVFVEKVLGIPAGSDKAKIVFPADHVATRYAQFWIDQIDKVWREGHFDAMKNTPKPNALVINEPSSNAFVAGASHCFDVDVNFDNMPLEERLIV